LGGSRFIQEKKGIAGAILKKLAEAARENGLLSLVAYVMPKNTGMIKLFKKLPYKIKTKIESGMLILSCNFEEDN
jgi:L-amino acid N-acyltransferase YncA